MKPEFIKRLTEVVDDMCEPAINYSDKKYWEYRYKRAREAFMYLRKIAEEAEAFYHTR